eukprot:2358637-Rhodomonas_salina.3
MDMAQQMPRERRGEATGGMWFLPVLPSTMSLRLVAGNATSVRDGAKRECTTAVRRHGRANIVHVEQELRSQTLRMRPPLSSRSRWSTEWYSNSKQADRNEKNTSASTIQDGIYADGAYQYSTSFGFLASIHSSSNAGLDGLNLRARAHISIETSIRIRIRSYRHAVLDKSRIPRPQEQNMHEHQDPQAQHEHHTLPARPHASYSHTPSFPCACPSPSLSIPLLPVSYTHLRAHETEADL